VVIELIKAKTVFQAAFFPDTLINGDRPSFYLYFSLAAEHKPFKAMVLFYVSEYRLYVEAALLSLLYALLAI